ncbi:MAG TPA: PadR family transcriptional regulator [Pseudonocardiaceae bacterium]|nr:PadR family transcriptional regulator [Pseudonocardiaceae bacterium]
MSNARLSPTSYLVLGMIALRGPSTSYDLKRAVSHSVGFFWYFPHAQLYSEPQRLVELGLLEVESEESGRRRRTFSVTDAGRAALRQWLAEPTEEHFEMRNVAELKLFFSETGEPDNVVELAHQQRRQHQQRLAEYEAIQDRFGDNADVASRMITLQLGTQIELATLRFWDALIAELESGKDPLSPADYLHGLRKRLAEP